MFFASGSKSHSIYKGFWLAPSKNTGIYAVFSMSQEDARRISKGTKTLNYSVLALGKHRKNSKNPPKSAQN